MKLPPPAAALLALQLDLSLPSQHASHPVGGRTLPFASNWGKLTHDNWVLNTIRGYRLPLNSWPDRQWVFTPPAEDQLLFIQEEVGKLLAKGAAKRVPQSQVLVSSPFFIVPKSGGGFRPILDLRYINLYLEAPHFKMEGLFMLPTVVQQEWVLGKIDLKDAYLTIPVAQEFHQLLAFQTAPHRFIQFVCLPFGLCTAPYVFSKVTKPVVQFLRQQGIHCILYLDDLLVAAPNSRALLQDLSTVLWLLVALGFVINTQKSVTLPTHRLEYLGFVVDTREMSISLPESKVKAIQKEATLLLSAETVQIRKLAHFIGTLVATKAAVHTAPLHFRALQHLKITSLHKFQSYQARVQFSPEAVTNLRWWKDLLQNNCSTPILKPNASVVIESDASMLGWGAVCQEVRTGGKWTALESQLHINVLELKAALLAIQCFLKDKSNISVLIRMDNRAAIAHINKMGGPILSPLSQMAQEFWSWCLEHKVLPHAEHLPGKENVLADWESRHLSDSSDWQLLPSVFESLQSLLGPFSIDLFASRTNYQLPEYCSWKPDPTAVAIDAFSIPWSSRQPYLFPPFNLVGRSLTKIQMEAVTSACLIAPAWPAQSWYPQLLDMLTRKPIMLPPEEDLLLSPELTPHPLILEGRLPLAAWVVSGKSTPCKAFQAELLTSCSSPGEATHTQLMTQPGQSGIAGAVKGKLIPFVHLWDI